MGFNKKLLGHFSETLRCNQYPKRYLGDEARFTIFLPRVTLSAYFISWGTWYWIAESTRKESIFNLPDSASRMRFMVHLWHHFWWKEGKEQPEQVFWRRQGNSRAFQHQFVSASDSGFFPHLRANPRLKDLRCVSEVSG